MLDLTLNPEDLATNLLLLWGQRKSPRAGHVDLSAQDDTLQLLLTGSEVQMSAKVDCGGVARVPTELLSRVQESLHTFGGSVRVRISPGELRLGNSVIRHERIALREKPRGIIGIPDDASDFDLASLLDLYTPAQLADADLTSRVNRAAETMEKDVSQAAELLAKYGIPVDQTRARVHASRGENAETLRRVLADRD